MPNLSKENWRVNTSQLLEEITKNKGASQLVIPLRIFNSILAEIAKRAIELDDKEMNKLMLRLSLYEVSNPKSKEYNPKTVTEYLSM